MYSVQRTARAGQREMEVEKGVWIEVRFGATAVAVSEHQLILSSVQ